MRDESVRLIILNTLRLAGYEVKESRMDMSDPFTWEVVASIDGYDMKISEQPKRVLESDPLKKLYCPKWGAEDPQ